MSEKLRTFIPGVTFWSNRYYPTSDGPEQETLTVTRVVETGTSGDRKRSYEVEHHALRDRRDRGRILYRR